MSSDQFVQQQASSMANSNSIKSLVLFGLLSTILAASYLIYGLYKKMEHNSTIKRVISIKENAKEREHIILEDLKKVETRIKNSPALDEAAKKVELELIAFKKIVNGFSVAENEVLEDRTKLESLINLCDFVDNASLKLKSFHLSFLYISIVEYSRF